MLSPSADNLLLGKGEVLFARKAANGTLGAYRHMGNVETFELTTTDDVIEKYSNMDAAASLYKRVTRRRDVVLRLTLDEYTQENLALALMGEEAVSAAQAATAVVAEVLAADVVQGAFYKTAKLGPITAVTLTNATTSTALVLNTDYVIHNADIGIIQILENAPNVADNDNITISYTPTAYASGLDQVRGGTESLVEGAVLFLPDPTTGPKMQVQVWSVSVTPDGALGLISDEFSQIALSMAVQADRVNHPTEPLYLITYLP